MTNFILSHFIYRICRIGFMLTYSYKIWKLVNKCSEPVMEILEKALTHYRSSHQRSFVKKPVLKIFLILTGKYLCWSLLVKLRPATLLQWTATQALSCQHYEILKNSYLEENLRTAASGSMSRELDFQTSTETATRGVLWCEKNVIRNFARYTGKHQRQSLLFNKVAQGSGLQLYYKRDLGTGVFRGILRNF